MPSRSNAGMHNVETWVTDHLAARRMRAGDFAEIFRLHTDERVVATLGGPRTDAQTREYLHSCLDHWEKHRWGQWMFDERMHTGDERTPTGLEVSADRGALGDSERGQFVGRCGLRHYGVAGADVGSDEIELLYTLRAEYWGRGWATEMARAVLQRAFRQLGLETVVAFTLPTNRASQRMMEKSGMRYEREITHANRPHVLYRAAARDCDFGVVEVSS